MFKICETCKRKNAHYLGKTVYISVGSHAVDPRRIIKLKQKGHTVKDIAKIVNLSTNRVYVILKELKEGRRDVKGTGGVPRIK